MSGVSGASEADERCGANGRANEWPIFTVTIQTNLSHCARPIGQRCVLGVLRFGGGSGSGGGGGGGVGGGRGIAWNDSLLTVRLSCLFKSRDGLTDGPTDLRTGVQTLLCCGGEQRWAVQIVIRTGVQNLSRTVRIYWSTLGLVNGVDSNRFLFLSSLLCLYKN